MGHSSVLVNQIKFKHSTDGSGSAPSASMPFGRGGGEAIVSGGTSGTTNLLLQGAAAKLQMSALVQNCFVRASNR
jgi:hypothetical protein